jgi:hypothetical protein
VPKITLFKKKRGKKRFLGKSVAKRGACLGKSAQKYEGEEVLQG